MGRASSKENKNAYQIAGEAQQLSRGKASEELEWISITVETLQLWTEQMMANGTINPEQYHKLVKK